MKMHNSRTTAINSQNIYRPNLRCNENMVPRTHFLGEIYTKIPTSTVSGRAYSTSNCIFKSCTRRTNITLAFVIVVLLFLSLANKLDF